MTRQHAIKLIDTLLCFLLHLYLSFNLQKNITNMIYKKALRNKQKAFLQYIYRGFTSDMDVNTPWPELYPLSGFCPGPGEPKSSSLFPVPPSMLPPEKISLTLLSPTLSWGSCPYGLLRGIAGTMSRPGYSQVGLCSRLCTSHVFVPEQEPFT